MIVSMLTQISTGSLLKTGCLLAVFGLSSALAQAANTGIADTGAADSVAAAKAAAAPEAKAPAETAATPEQDANTKKFIAPELAPRAERPVYPTAGFPVQPKVDARWNRYRDYEEATELLQALAKTFPQYCKLESLGQSYGNREMWVLTITNFEKGTDTEKPAFWIDGGIHANEIQATEAVLYTAWYLLEMAETNKVIRNLLDDRTFYLMPMMSPDARDAHFYEPNTTHSPRTGMRPVDDDRDGQIDEDGFDDLDGDGHITQMRVADKNGRYKRHPKYPDLMIRAQPDEPGEYTLLGTEGFDNDGDGQINEDGPGYYDPNRDWPWFWQPSYVQRGAHHYPFSILENRMVGDFIRSRPNIAAGQAFHNAGGMILRVPGAKSDRIDHADIQVYDVLGKRGEQILPSYRYMTIGEDLYETYGGELDWLHQVRGAFVFTNELFPGFNFFKRQSGEGFFATDEDQRLFDRYLLLEDGIQPWTEVDHPQYGKIEVGGLKRSWLRQPPSFLLEEECHRNMAFVLYHASEMPKVQIQSVEVKRIGDNLFEVLAVVVNQRLMPTHSGADLRHKITPPDLMAITGKEIQVISGTVSDDQFFRSAVEQRREPEELKIANIPGKRAVYVRWLIEGAGPYTVSLTSIKGGRDTAKINTPRPKPAPAAKSPTPAANSPASSANSPAPAEKP